MCVLETWPRWLVMALSVTLVLALGVLDHVTGTELNIAVLFLLPIVPVTWLFGMRWAFPIAALSGMTMFTANHLSGLQYGNLLIPLWNFGSRFILVMLVARAIVYLHQTAVKAESLARIDPLTGVGNVRYFREAAELEIARARRYYQTFTMAFIDADDFKRINDSYGHESGDRMLRLIGESLTRSVRSTDLVARVGGDEFVLLLPMMSAEAAEGFLRKLRERLLAELAHPPGPLTCSIGAVTFETPPASVDEMLKLADDRMYLAKQIGRDTIRHGVISGSTSAALAPRAAYGSAVATEPVAPSAAPLTSERPLDTPAVRRMTRWPA